MFVTKDEIGNKLVLNQLRAWCQIGSKPWQVDCCTANADQNIWCHMASLGHKEFHINFYIFSKET